MKRREDRFVNMSDNRHGRPMSKRSRGEKSTLTFASFERLLSSHFNAVALRLDSLESSINQLVGSNQRHSCCDEVLSKLSVIEQILQPEQVSPSMIHDEMEKYENEDAITHMLQSSTIPVVLISNQKPNQVTASLGLDSTVQVITLNSETDFKDGSWLGDEANADTRVRCAISPTNLVHINSTCTTPEKMALKLLDYLFPRDVLSMSNLSGKGPHGKQQLNPLMIYGIRCHIMHKFNITEGHWFRIKQNMDSKCRTAWRKRSQVGVSAGGKRRKEEAMDTMTEENEFREIVSDDGQSIFVTSGQSLGDYSDDELESKMSQMQGDVKVLHATPEQLLRLQQRHHYRLLSSDQLLPVSVLEESHVLCEDDGMIDAGEEMLEIVDNSVDVMVNEELEYVNVGAMVGDDNLLLVDDEGEGNMVNANLISGD